MKGTAPIRVISFLLLAGFGIFCQNSPSTDKASQPDGPNPPEVQLPETRAWQSLPDAPSPVQPPPQRTAAGAIREIEPGNVTLTLPPQSSFTSPYARRFTQNQSDDSFSRYLVFQTPKPDSSYAPSTSSSFLGRATYAASSGFLTHSASGKPRLNTSFFLGMLALAAVHTAYRPYWQRTGPAVGGDFGVSIGSDAGMNIFHEFEPAIREKTRSITPKFVYRLEQRFTGGQTPLSIPER